MTTNRAYTRTMKDSLKNWCPMSRLASGATTIREKITAMRTSSASSWGGTSSSPSPAASSTSVPGNGSLWRMGRTTAQARPDQDNRRIISSSRLSVLAVNAVYPPFTAKTRRNFVSSNGRCGARQFEGELADLSQIHLSRAKVREGIDLEESVRTRHPEIRQVGLREFLEAILQPVLRESVQDHEALPFLFIRHSRNGKALLADRSQLVQLLLHLHVRDHFSADLAETAEAVGDSQEPVFVQSRDISRHVPSVAQNFRGLFRAAEIPLHDVGPAHEKQSGLPQR